MVPGVEAVESVLKSFSFSFGKMNTQIFISQQIYCNITQHNTTHHTITYREYFRSDHEVNYFPADYIVCRVKTFYILKHKKKHTTMHKYINENV